MSNNTDYYKILELDKNATPEDIKRAYKKQAMKWHPDRNPDNKEAEEKFKEINRANEVLSDPEKKSNYDRFGTENGPQNPFGGGDMNDIFGEDFLSQFFGGRGTRRNSVRRGSDIRMNVSLSLKEIYNGVKKNIKLKRNIKCSPCNGQGGQDVEPCRSCNGSGQYIKQDRTQFGIYQQIMPCPFCDGAGKTIKVKCSTCHGHGVNLADDEIMIDIPKGVMSGMTLKIGKGHESKDGISGDLLLTIIEDNKTEFIREQNDIYLEKKLSVIDMILGTEFEFTSIDDKVYKISVDPGTQNGKAYRMKGKGMPLFNNHNYGDLYVQISVVIPSALTKEESDVLNKLKESDNFKLK